jgi:TetR/AcrR family transcriptional regulator, cholesterol catabolism regulator
VTREGRVDGRLDRSGATTDARRAAILVAAIDIFATNGYAGASTREVARAVGLEQGHLYYYFRAKEDLLYEVVCDLHDRFLEGTDQWCQEFEDPEARAQNVFRGHVELLCARHRQTTVAYENWRYLSSDRRDEIAKKRDRYESIIGELVSALGTNDTLAVKAILGTLNWTYQWYSPGGPQEVPVLAERLSLLALTLAHGGST